MVLSATEVLFNFDGCCAEVGDQKVLNMMKHKKNQNKYTVVRINLADLENLTLFNQKPMKEEKLYIYFVCKIFVIKIFHLVVNYLQVLFFNTSLRVAEKILKNLILVK